MTFGEWLTAVIGNYANAGGDDGTTARLRARAAFHGQALVKKAWTYKSWSWRRTSGTVALTAQLGYGDLPTDFSSFGTRGGVYISGQMFPLRFRPADILFSLRQTESGYASRPEFYTLRGVTASSGRRQIHVHKKNSGALTLALENYDRLAPVCVDYPAAATTAEGAAGNLTGAYTYRITFVTADGETEGGDISTSRSVTSKKIELSGIPVSTVSTVTSRKIYRTTGSGSAWKLVATLADNTTTTYSDNIADGSLGAAIPTAATAITGLEQIPSDWHETLMYDGLVARLMASQGDLRSTEQDSQFLAGLRDLWVNQKEDRNRVPRSARYGASAFR